MLPYIVKKELLIITEDGTQATKILKQLKLMKKVFVNGIELNPVIKDFSLKYEGLMISLLFPI